MDGATKAANAAIGDYRERIAKIRNTHPDLIARLESLTTAARGTDDQAAIEAFFDDLIDEAKGSLGSIAANACSDDEREQEKAISLCEDWVADNISNADIEAWILCALDTLGIDEGTAAIDEAVAKVPSVRLR